MGVQSGLRLTGSCGKCGDTVVRGTVLRENNNGTEVKYESTIRRMLRPSVL